MFAFLIPFHNTFTPREHTRTLEFLCILRTTSIINLCLNFNIVSAAILNFRICCYLVLSPQFLQLIFNFFAVTIQTLSVTRMILKETIISTNEDLNKQVKIKYSFVY